MLEIQSFLEHKIIIYAGAILYFLFRYRKEIKDLFPSSSKSLERFKISKEFIEKKVDTKKLTNEENELISFYQHEIENYNFQNITKLNRTDDNVKILSLYNTISDKIKWNDFIKIKNYIKNRDSLIKIEDKIYKTKYYISIGLQVMLILIVLFGILYAYLNFLSDKERFYSVFTSSVILITMLSFNLIHHIYMLSVINNYNYIVECMVKKKEEDSK